MACLVNTTLTLTNLRHQTRFPQQQHPVLTHTAFDYTTLTHLRHQSQLLQRRRPVRRPQEHAAGVVGHQVVAVVGGGVKGVHVVEHSLRREEVQCTGWARLIARRALG